MGNHELLVCREYDTVWLFAWQYVPGEITERTWGQGEQRNTGTIQHELTPSNTTTYIDLFGYRRETTPYTLCSDSEPFPPL